MVISRITEPNGSECGDPTTVEQIITLIRSLAPHVTIVARGRYKLFAEDLRRAGADLVVDEETETGRLMAGALS